MGCVFSLPEDRRDAAERSVNCLLCSSIEGSYLMLEMVSYHKCYSML